VAPALVARAVARARPTELARHLRGHLRGDYRRPLSPEFVEPLRGARALEIGGPSPVFATDGLLPVYPVLASLDGVQAFARTAWHELDPAAGYAPEQRRTGDLHLVDGVSLDGLPDGAYDAVLCSHVLEHIANPLRALASWRRVTQPGGYLLIVAPHMEGTFDHRRTLAHLSEDFAADVGEDDLTHLPETLALHDHARDADSADLEAWAAARRDNAHTRLLHHHTFTTPSLLALLEHAGLEILAAEARLPHDIYVLGRFAEAGSVSPAARDAVRRSPFRRDP
jgi:SAM-dependent methyltransferase